MATAPERSTYTALDLLAFRESGSLEVVPKFQRRQVWKTPARSFFIDTLIRGYPVPPLYLRVTQSHDKSRTVREVVDGQQRVRAILAYLDGEYALTRTLDERWAGRDFAELTTKYQDAIRQYPLTCEVLHGVSDARVLELFARLNTYSVRLNAQELRNGTYFGVFKQAAYGLALEHLEFWRRHKIMSETAIARMLEVELTSELMILMLDGLQDKKGSIGRFYATFDDAFQPRARVERRFRYVVDEISESFGNVLRETEFRRAPLFYSLFGAVYHRRFGLRRVDLPTPKQRLSAVERRRLRDHAVRLSEHIQAARRDEPVPGRVARFVNASLRQTDNVQPRRTRLREIYRAFG